MNPGDGQWPTAADYAAAMQDTEQCMLDERLREATPVLNMMGIPSVRSGQTAAVFRADIWENDAAIRFFTAPSAQIERYRRLSDHLEQHPNPLYVQSEWIPEAVAVGTGVFPAVLMPWVPGVSLTTFVEDALDDGDLPRIHRLADAWAAAAMTLPHSMIVHADLQHGNVMVADDLSIRLIDYDSTWVPGLPTRLAEVGHPNYQHPERSEQLDVTGTTDVFSAFVIYVSLRAIASDPLLWDKLHNGENLLFVQSDFVDAGRKECPAWEALAKNPDPAVVGLTETLFTLCRVHMRAIPDLGRLLQDGRAAIDISDVYVPERAGRESGGDWWDAGEESGEPDPQDWDRKTPWVDRSSGASVVTPTRDSRPAPPTGQQAVVTGAVPLADLPAPPDSGTDRDATLRRAAMVAMALAIIALIVVFILAS